MAQRKWRRGRRVRPRDNKIGMTNHSRQAHRSRSNPFARSLRFEPLEDRRLLAVFSVSHLGDLDAEGDVVYGSLRKAIELANANDEADTIVFEDFLFSGPGPGTIFLDPRENGGPLLLTDESGITIIGPGAGVLTIYAAGNNRIFLVNDTNDDNSSSVTISGLTLANGRPSGDDEDGFGGAILNHESLTLEEVKIHNSFAPSGGGAIFNAMGGFLQVDRSLILNNSSGAGGGGIQNGIADEEENLPTTTVVNSTITGNTALGTPGGENGYGGGGVLNLAGTVNIEQSTIFDNSTSAVYGGGGVASWGFDPEADDMGMPSVYSGLATTNIRSSIIVGNTALNAPDDVASIGMTEDPPTPFQPQINSLGYNLFGVLTLLPTTANLAITLPPKGPDDIANVNPLDVFIDDPVLGEAWLNDFGGVLPVFMPDINKAGGLLAIDRGDPNARGDYDQRGYQFVRVFDATTTGTPRMDIGAAEVQVGNFFVDTLVDETDGRFSSIPVVEGFFPSQYIGYFAPDFSLREALEFVEKNSLSGLPDVSTISFSNDLTDPQLNPDPTIGTPAPTILLTLGNIAVNIPVDIIGPAFDLEIDASGNDLTPGTNDGQGSLVFSIFDTATISNLILRGGDQQEFGGAIYVASTGDLTLKNSTLLDNNVAGNGGAIFVNGGTLFVDATTIHDNTASNDGGGIYVASGNVIVNNSTISGNVGMRHGGGITNKDGNLTIQYSTITLNTAGTLSSGVASFRDASAVTNIRSSIISDNTVNDVQHIQNGTDSIASLGYNLVGTGNAVSAGIFSMLGDQSFITDPMLAPLARLGGPTPVHRLLPGSPAVDAGDPNAAGLGYVPTQDQRGFPFDRIENLAGGGVIDIGAFEVQDGMLLVGDVTMGASFETFAEALDESNLTPTMEEIIFLPTWIPESFPSTLAITDSVDIFGDGNGVIFPGLEILIDDNSTSLIDVSFDDFRFQNNTRIVSKENLTLTRTQFANNTATNINGGAISQQYGKLAISDSSFIGNSVSGAGSSGGAIHVLDGDLEMNNSFLTGNSTGVLGGKGGAIYIRDGNFTGNYLYVTGNVATAATGKGGGIYGRDSTMVLTSVTISGNSTTGSNSEGGGVSAKDSDITLIDSAITFNTTNASQSQGGGIFLDGGSLNIQNGNLFRNRTYGQLSSGGGISSVNVNVTIASTSINGNEVTGNLSDGGGIHAVGGNLTVRDSAVIYNKTGAPDTRGGGIFSQGNLSGLQTTEIINSTISGNSTLGRGGGLYNAGGLTVVKHSTITANDAPYVGDAGGVGSRGNASTTRTEVYSSIIAGNTANAASSAADFDNDEDVDGFDFLAWQRGFGIPAPLASKSDGDADGDQDVDTNDLRVWESAFGTGKIASDVDRVGDAFDETFLSLGYNLIGDGLSVAAFNATGDQTGVLEPMLDILANNGGPTKTHAILAGSPAINAGDPAFDPNSATPALDFDQRGTGFARVLQGQIDVGAYESDFAPASLAAGFGDGAGADAPLASYAAATEVPQPSGVVETQVPAATSSTNSLAYAVQSLDVDSPSPSLQPVQVTREELRGVDTLWSQLNSRVTSSFLARRDLLVEPLTAWSDELEAVARDTSLARFALPAGRMEPLSDRFDLGDLAASLHLGADSQEELAAEDFVFQLLGEEEQ